MEAISYYSEEEYRNKKEIFAMYGHPAGDCLWEEILAYRNQYFYSLDFSNRNYYVTLNKTLFLKMERVYEIQFEDYHLIPMLPYLNEETLGIESVLIHYQKWNPEKNSSNQYRYLVKEGPVLIKVFVIACFYHDEQLLYLFLALHHKSGMFPLVQEWQHYHLKNGFDRDLTYDLRDFLDFIYFKSQKNMIKLKGDELDNLSFEALRLRFPMLNEKQLQFYFSHHECNCYYLISHYAKFADVSYETARKAMEMLYEYHFYQKQKIGKKFVYYTVG